MLSLTWRRDRPKSTSKKKRERSVMGGDRKPILVGLALFMVLGFAVYFRLWTIDYSVSSDDTELLRRQFDLANREAMDESAEWRLKYDEEVQRTSKCEKELMEIKQSFVKENEVGGINQKLDRLQEENMALRKQMEILRQELEAAKLKCHSQLIN